MYNKTTLDLYQQRLDATIEARNSALAEHEIGWDTMHQAWFMMAHMLLSDDAHVVHMGAGDGSLTFAMAALYPHIHFTGLDKNKKKVAAANKKFDLDNLDFKIGDATGSLFPKGSLDAIIDSNFLHVVYSGQDYNELAIQDTLKNHYNMLKMGGQLFIRDFAGPDDDNFVLLELRDRPSLDKSVSQLSDPDLLLWFSEHVKPSQDFGYSGFFLEELPSQFEGSRLFRLPHKWAYEFILRCDQAEDWEDEPPVEYTFFSSQDMRESLGYLGMRIPYSAPQWDETKITSEYTDRFRLYRDDGSVLDYPASSFVTLGVKAPERQSLQVSERRPAPRDGQPLSITTMRNDKTGALTDIIEMDYNFSDIIPYYIGEDGRLKVYLHAQRIRSIANTIPRAGGNITGQRYSGHMIEAIRVDANNVPELDGAPQSQHTKFAKDYCGLKLQKRSSLERGPLYYPAADYIDQRIQCYYMAVTPSKDDSIMPPRAFYSRYRFQERGHIQEFDAQQILDAITVGLIPDAHLEREILALFNILNLKPENWSIKSIQFQRSEALKSKSASLKLKPPKMEDVEYTAQKESADQLRSVNSIFVEEGQAGGMMAGLAHEQISFVLHNENTENIAAILPLCKDAKGEIHAGFLMENMAVPKRHEGDSTSMASPRFILPADVKNVREVKKYIADKLSVLPEHVIKLGEPYFTHLSVTPQKIFPFAVSVPPSLLSGSSMHFIPYKEMAKLRSALSKDTHMLTLIARSYRYFNDKMRMDAKISSKFKAQESMKQLNSDFSMPLSFYSAPLMPVDGGAIAPDGQEIMPHLDPNAGAHGQNRSELGHEGDEAAARSFVHDAEHKDKNKSELHHDHDTLGDHNIEQSQRHEDNKTAAEAAAKPIEFTKRGDKLASVNLQETKPLAPPVIKLKALQMPSLQKLANQVLGSIDIFGQKAKAPQNAEVGKAQSDQESLSNVADALSKHQKMAANDDEKALTRKAALTSAEQAKASHERDRLDKQRQEQALRSQKDLHDLRSLRERREQLDKDQDSLSDSRKDRQKLKDIEDMREQLARDEERFLHERLLQNQQMREQKEQLESHERRDRLIVEEERLLREQRELQEQLEQEERQREIERDALLMAKGGLAATLAETVSDFMTPFSGQDDNNSDKNQQDRRGDNDDDNDHTDKPMDQDHDLEAEADEDNDQDNDRDPNDPNSEKLEQDDDTADLTSKDGKKKKKESSQRTKAKTGKNAKSSKTATSSKRQNQKSSKNSGLSNQFGQDLKSLMSSIQSSKSKSAKADTAKPVPEDW